MYIYVFYTEWSTGDLLNSWCANHASLHLRICQEHVYMCVYHYATYLYILCG